MPAARPGFNPNLFDFEDGGKTAEDITYTDPVTKVTEPKTFYYEKVGSDVCGVGVYHP